MRKLALLAASLPALAFAGDLDLDLSRYATVFRQGDANPDGGAPINCNRAQGEFCYVIPDNQKFYSLASELGVVLAPKFLMPAETLGYNGFSFGFQSGFTDISEDQPFWDAVKQFDPNDPEPERPPSFVNTIGVMAHKGIWLPLPSFELGAGFNYLPRSGMWMMMVDTKFALHEGFMLPAVAVRGTGGRMVGNNQMDLTIAGLDFSMSKSFGVFGTFNLTPYAGYQILWIVADPEVLDATPGEDAIDASRGSAPQVVQCSDDEADCNAYFVFFDPDPILRHRIFIGTRLIIGVFNITAEFAMATRGTSSHDEIAQSFDSDGELVSSDTRPVKDLADAQPAAHVMVGLDF
jgi:hypothetical protein